MKGKAATSLFAQLAFTVIAFVTMVLLSYLFMRDIVHKNIARNADSVFTFAQTQLESDLIEPKTVIRGFSHTVTGMIARGDTIDVISSYLSDFTEYINLSNSRIIKSSALYGYLELSGEQYFINNSNVPLDAINLQERPWYRDALLNCGEIIETVPYEHAITGIKVVSYARCIHDADGNHTGVIAMNINVDDIGANIINIALNQGGYGVLVSSDYTIIAHVNKDYIGRYITDSDIPLSLFSEDFLAGKDISQRPLVNWKGENTVAFFKKMPNGWYIGLLTPEGPFYEDLTTMAVSLIILGTMLAAILIIILIRIDSARNRSDRESRHKSAFLANMSHEIRTPMNAIIGMTAIGKTSADIERKDHCFLKIEDASNHLLGVINDILDMSKIEANKFDFSSAEFNFEKMLQRVVNVVNFRMDEKRHEFSVHIDQRIPKTLIGDDQRIVQVITNLLGNAIKFTHEGGSISLDARFLEEKDDICSIQFSVTDNGIGMTPEQQKRIFSSFEQAETSTTRKYGGTGLGLAISRNIVEMMGGRIWVISDIDKGSTFAFVLQLKRGIQAFQGLLPPDVNLNNVRILVVDDDRDILDYFIEITHEFKVQCDAAISGEEAIRLVEKNGSYHIYFIDWRMPGMDGIQLTAELKARHEFAKSIVIMITAAEWTTVEAEARKAGVDRFLAKPLFPSHIADIINEAIGVDQKKIDEKKTDLNGMFAGRRILLVEDVEINREIVKALLEPTHIEIDCAENGKEALQKFSDEPYKYDIIFMDVQMPEMDGYEATRRIRALKVPQAQTIRIVAMTANVFREDIEMCLESGMDNHIGKPLNFDEIIEKLQIYLPKKRQLTISN